VAFGVIAAAVSAVVFAGPLVETRRRSVSVHAATQGTAAGEGAYRTLLEAEQQRAYRIAALMTERPERATAIVEEAFAHLLQRWTRLREDERVRYLLSFVVKRSLGEAFVGELASGEVQAPDEATDRLRRAARALAVLEPQRRAIVVLSESERFAPDEVAALLGLDSARVQAEVRAGLEQLGPVLATVAA
jgi:DNA-directed RNA polymerase specialized sigma24 family protein